MHLLGYKVAISYCPGYMPSVYPTVIRVPGGKWLFFTVLLPLVKITFQHTSCPY